MTLHAEISFNANPEINQAAFREGVTPSGRRVDLNGNSYSTEDLVMRTAPFVFTVALDIEDDNEESVREALEAEAFEIGLAFLTEAATDIRVSGLDVRDVYAGPGSSTEEGAYGRDAIVTVVDVGVKMITITGSES